MSSTADTLPAPRPQRAKFLLGGLLIAAAIVYLIASTTQSTSQYFYTVVELSNQGAAATGENVRISGAVLGDSIQYNPDSLELRFTIAHVPGDQDEVDARGGLATVLHEAITDPHVA